MLFIFALGLIVGSFLNVVILRYNTGKSVGGRSACFSCGNGLKWHHLIPLVSFLALRGRCAFCRSKISWQYPLVELATALIFIKISSLHLSSSFPTALLTTHYSLLLILTLISASLLVVIFVYDLRHKIIPDGIVFGFIGVSFISLLLRHSDSLGYSGAIIDFVSAMVIFLFFFSLWYFSKGTWMGLGDGKLALGIGMYLSWPANLSAIIIAFWVGAVFGLLLIAYEHLSRKRNGHSMKSELPFAPFMIIGFFVALFMPIDLISLLIL